MASLTGTKIKDTYDALLKVSDNGALDGTLQTITDGLGNNSALSLSTAGASVGGTLAVSGNLAVDTNTLFVDASSDSVSINDNVTANVPLTVTTNSGYEDVLYLKSSGTNIDSRISMFPTGTGNAVINAGTNSLEFQIGGSEKVRVDSSGDISFRDSSANEAFYWDASAASLGIGGVPTAKLDVNSGATNQAAAFRSTDSGAFIGFADPSTTLDAGYPTVSVGAVANDMTFATNNTERMRIDSSGRVGIGQAPSTWSTGAGKVVNVLQLNGNGALFTRADETYLSQNFYYNSSDSGAVIDAGRGSIILCTAGEIKFFGTTVGASSGAVVSTQERMRITSGGYLKASNDGSYLNASGGYHELRTDADGRIGIFTNKSATLTGENGLEIRFTAASPNNTTSKVLVFEDSSAVRFIVNSNGNVQNTNNSYGAISDIKVKENIVDATPKLDKLMDVRVVNYNLIGDDKKQLGVVAQELEQVFPSMIDESPDYEEVEVPQLDENGQEVLDENGEVVMTKERVDLGTVTKSVKYSVFVPMLIKAIQELKAEVDSLKSQLNA